jgi:hypothetical protein
MKKLSHREVNQLAKVTCNNRARVWTQACKYRDFDFNPSGGGLSWVLGALCLWDWGAGLEQGEFPYLRFEKTRIRSKVGERWFASG